MMSALSLEDLGEGGGPQGSCEVGQRQLRKGRREAAMAERGKEQLAVVLLCLFFHISAKEGDTGC